MQTVPTRGLRIAVACIQEEQVWEPPDDLTSQLAETTRLSRHQTVGTRETL